jgi:hypothetical protein
MIDVSKAWLDITNFRNIKGSSIRDKWIKQNPEQFSGFPSD